MLPFPDSAKSLGVAVAIGILIGIERERRKGGEAGREPAGVRTFTLVAMAGALARLLAEPILLGVAGLLVAGGTLLSYLRTSRTDPGLTTEVALVITFLLGVMAVDDLRVAAGAGALRARMRVAVRHGVRNLTNVARCLPGARAALGRAGREPGARKGWRFRAAAGGGWW